MIHHRRGHAGAIETRILREGVVVSTRQDSKLRVAVVLRDRVTRPFRMAKRGGKRPPGSHFTGDARLKGRRRFLSVRQFVGEDFHSLDLRRLHKQIRRLRP